MTFSPEIHEAAAVITFLSPGLRFFHQGQFEGRRKRISAHLCRGPDEPVNRDLKQFYERLLNVMSACPSQISAIATGDCRICLGTHNTIAMGTTCNQEDYRWMCLLGSTMPLT